MFWSAVVAAVVGLACPLPRAQADIILGDSALQIGTASGNSDRFITGPQSLSANPYSSAHSAGTDINFIAGTYAFTSDRLNLAINQTRTGEYSRFGDAHGDILFTPTITGTYAASGTYAVTDTTAPGYVVINASLYDRTDGQFRFDDAQTNYVTPNTQFTLGGATGDGGNRVIGSLTGPLVAGHTYELKYGFFTQAYPEADGGATAVGQLTLNLTPEPGTAAGIAVLALGAVGRRRRERKTRRH